MSNVVEELRAWLEDGGFPALPLPRRFHADLQKKGGCFYSTLGDGPVPYNFDECVAAVRAGAPDHLVVAHQGHGINSYAFSYHLVTGQVRLLLQLSWGGVYQSEESRTRTREMLRVVAECGPDLEKRAAIGPPLFVAWSDLYSEAFRAAPLTREGLLRFLNAQ